MSKHRRSIPLAPHADVQNDATCVCRNLGPCPRHFADTYADQYARHATDSIGPLMVYTSRDAQDRAAAFHSSNQFGR